MSIWLIIGLIVTLYIVYGREKSEEAKAKNKRIKEAFANDALYYAVKAPAAIFWISMFSLMWPVLVYIEFFFRKK